MIIIFIIIHYYYDTNAMVPFLFLREHRGRPGPCGAGGGLRHHEGGALLAGEELVVHLLGQRRLRPHVHEGQQLRSGHRRYVRHAGVVCVCVCVRGCVGGCVGAMLA